MWISPVRFLFCGVLFFYRSIVDTQRHIVRFYFCFCYSLLGVFTLGLCFMQISRLGVSWPCSQCKLKSQTLVGASDYEFSEDTCFMHRAQEETGRFPWVSLWFGLWADSLKADSLHGHWAESWGDPAWHLLCRVRASTRVFHISACPTLGSRYYDLSKSVAVRIRWAHKCMLRSWPWTRRTGSSPSMVAVLGLPTAEVKKLRPRKNQPWTAGWGTVPTSWSGHYVSLRNPLMGPLVHIWVNWPALKQ